MKEPVEIYVAAALFNARETFFNSQLVEDLEKLGYKTNFPQRDGFEFGDLTKAFSDKLQKDKICSAVQTVIYFLDMGVFVPKSDVVLANFDGPLDEGVVVEVSYAKLMGKFVIGFRTDVRSPYGALDESFGGMHFFPAYQSRAFISHHMPSKTPEERVKQMGAFVEKIDLAIESAEIVHQESPPDYVKNNPHMSAVLEGASLLFDGIEDIHSEEGMNEIVSRYLAQRKRLKELLTAAL